jgi:hypothetical protein
MGSILTSISISPAGINVIVSNTFINTEYDIFSPTWTELEELKKNFKIQQNNSTQFLKFCC